MSLKPLSGIRVLDLTWIYAGPFATQVLGDLGAEIIKIEAGPVGDKTRLLPPYRGNHSGYFASLNRGKQSVALNLKSPRGREIFLELARHCDILAENFMPGAMDGLGLGYEAVKHANPRIIYASTSGFGSYGPYSHMHCVDPVGQAMGGLMSLTGYAEMPPLKTGPGIADSITGLYWVIGILAALQQRNVTGRGQKLEVAMMDSIFTMLEENVIKTSMEGVPAVRRGNLDPFGAPWDCFQTRDDRWVMVCAFGGPVFEELYRIMGREDLVEKYGGDNMDAFLNRALHQDVLNKAFAEWVRASQTAGELVSLLVAMGVPAGIVKDVGELLDDPHLRARNMIVEMENPSIGRVKTYNIPIRFQDVALGVEPGANPQYPGLGEHSSAVLKALLGKSDSEIEALRAEGALWL